MALPEAGIDPVAAKTAEDAAKKAADDAAAVAAAEAATKQRADEDAARAAADRDSVARTAAQDARLAQLENLLTQGWKKTPPPESVQPIAKPEDFLTPEGTMNAVNRMTVDAASKVAGALTQHQASRDAQILSYQFDQEYEKLKSKPYFKYVQRDFEAAIQQNPRLRYAPQALSILYSSFVGERSTEIFEAERAGAPPLAVDPSRPRYVEAPGRTAAPTAPPPADTNKVVLSESEDRIRDGFNKIYGLDITPEGWRQRRRERGSIYSEAPNLTETGRN